MSEILQFGGDIFWDADDTENSIADPDDLMDEVGCGTVVIFEVAKRLPNMYGIQTYNKETDKYETRYFETKAEAEALVATPQGGQEEKP